MPEAKKAAKSEDLVVVKMLASLAATRFNVQPGQLIKVRPEVAEAWEAAGRCVRHADQGEPARVLPEGRKMSKAEREAHKERQDARDRKAAAQRKREEQAAKNAAKWLRQTQAIRDLAGEDDDEDDAA